MYWFVLQPWEATDILKQGCLCSVAELKWMDTKKASLLEGDQLEDHLSIAERQVWISAVKGRVNSILWFIAYRTIVRNKGEGEILNDSQCSGLIS